MSTNSALRQASTPSTSLRQRIQRAVNRNASLLLMALPAIVVLFTFSYLPMPGIILAFKDFKAAQGMCWESYVCQHHSLW